MNFTLIHYEADRNVKLVAHVRRSARRGRMDGNAPRRRQTKFLDNLGVNGRAACPSVYQRTDDDRLGNALALGPERLLPRRANRHKHTHDRTTWIERGC